MMTVFYVLVGLMIIPATLFSVCYVFIKARDTSTQKQSKWRKWIRDSMFILGITFLILAIPTVLLYLGLNILDWFVDLIRPYKNIQTIVVSGLGIVMTLLGIFKLGLGIKGSFIEPSLGSRRALQIVIITSSIACIFMGVILIQHGFVFGLGSLNWLSLLPIIFIVFANSICKYLLTCYNLWKKCRGIV